ncbi:MAG TPA: hypothetical protein VNC50_14080, partial [Planctomycetia bacterium]|nr:hypothetical protein [Planctomycetia bacterium]
MSDRNELVGWLPSAPTRELAGARLRCFLPLQYLAARGVAGEIFDPARSDRYDVCVFQKRYAEEDLRLAAELKWSGRRVILDQCDNHLYDPERRPVYQERAERLRRMLALADLVTVPTPELGRALGAPFAVVDDALDPVTPPTLKQRALALLQNARRRKRLLWFGNAGHDYPPFGLIDLARILGDLNQVAERCSIELLVISNDEAAAARATAGASFPVLYRRYETATFQSLARTADLCLLPVTENDFTRGKSVNRPALALRLG